MDQLNQAGKGPDARPGVHGKKWDACPLWANLKKRKAQQAKKDKKK